MQLRVHHLVLRVPLVNILLQELEAVQHVALDNIHLLVHHLALRVVLDGIHQLDLARVHNVRLVNIHLLDQVHVHRAQANGPIVQLVPKALVLHVLQTLL